MAEHPVHTAALINTTAISAAQHSDKQLSFPSLHSDLIFTERLYYKNMMGTQQLFFAQCSPIQFCLGALKH